MSKHFTFNKANLFGFAFIILAFIACEPSQSTQEDDELKVKPSAKKVIAKKDSTIAVEREYPKLDSANIESFLSEYFRENPERRVRVITRVGTLKVKLFDDTPLHTANFLMMTKRNYFTGTEFIRVAPNFVVQGGNNESEIEKVKRILIGSYTIPPEFKEERLHKKGALSMARDYENNPNKRSSPYYFFFVHGQKFNEPQLMAIERDSDMVIPQWKREIYKTIGGAPHLDNQHTVFGEIYEGLDVLDKMAAVDTDAGEWPITPLIMQIDIIDE
ncbi:peptidylprolyl isomerase [Cryomorphaceae bacterium 1068]|nr:peptidylprolyl isomerase [Cryomorphaceae bacterium 1068]